MGEYMSVAQELKKAIATENLSKAERILRQAKEQGILPRTTIIQIENYIAMSRWETTGESMAKLRALVATKL